MKSLSAFSLYANPSADFEQKKASALAILEKAAIDFGANQGLTQASSLGVEDMVITHLLHSAQISSEVFVLQTGKLHRQTLDLLQAVQERYGKARSIRIYEPDAKRASAFEQSEGADAMYKSQDLRKTCCQIRKMEPLGRALHGKSAWITGLRKEQSDARAEVKPFDTSVTPVKVSPLHDWTQGDVWHYVQAHQVPYNPLHDAFYPSIGCEPCTRAVTPGEDFRSGRWWWEQESAKECGLHAKD